MRANGHGFVRHSKDIEESEMEGGARIRWLITHRDGAPTFSMPLITIKKGKSTPHHSHDYEHEIFVVQGKLTVEIGNEFLYAVEGDHIFIPPNELHGMTALNDASIICVVPVRAARMVLGD
jgi:quercetin dioxygenase-like cupin family protein